MSRWIKEYLQSLQECQKWRSRRRNVRVDDIVLLKKSDVPQNQWSMGRIIDVNNDQKGLVRRVTLKIGERAGSENSKRKLESNLLTSLYFCSRVIMLNNDFQK